MIRLSSCAAALLTAGVVTFSSPAEACGCFAPPDPATPVVQAGERILFAVENGKVTAHIQIQYAGNAKDFGWIVPLPSVPVVKAGTDEHICEPVSVDVVNDLGADDEPAEGDGQRPLHACTGPQPDSEEKDQHAARSIG